MKDEIKEILDKLNENKNEIKTYCYYPDDVLSCDDLIKLLDYITNLQEENEKVHKDFEELSERYFFTKSRNEKAIKYIVKNMGQTIETGKEYFNNYSPCTDLLNILQGDDKDAKD